MAETNDLRPGLERVTSDLRAYYDVGYVAAQPEGRRPLARDRGEGLASWGRREARRRGYYALPPGALVVLPRELPLAEALAASPMPRDLEHRAATLRFADAGPATEVVAWVEVPLAGVALARGRDEVPRPPQPARPR